MKKAPLSRWEHRYLGQELFPETLSALEIEHFFTLDEQELARVRERRGPLNRLALALHVGFLKMTGNTLNSVERIPPEILDHLGLQLDCTPPRIATIRAFYRRRRRTLFEHHAAALRLLGRSELTPHAERGLVAYLRREATAVFDQAELVACARTWLVEHDYLLLRERDIRRHVIAARRSHEQVLFKVIAAAVPSEREAWVPRLSALIEGGEMSHLEWLGAVPSSRATKGLEEQIEKVDFLKELGADRLILPDLPLAGLEHFSRRMTSRKPAALARIKDPHRTIEVACFLRLAKLARAEQRYILTVFGYGSNLGPSQTARHAPGIAAAETLGRINAQHIDTAKLEAATTDLINAYARFALPKLWGPAGWQSPTALMFRYGRTISSAPSTFVTVAMAVSLTTISPTATLRCSPASSHAVSGRQSTFWTG